MVVNIFHEVVGCLQFLGSLKEFVLALAYEVADLALHESHVAHGLHHVARSRLALGAYHRSSFGNATESLAEVAGTADEGHVELGLVDVIDIVGG